MTRSHAAKRWLTGLSITVGTITMIGCGSGGEDGGGRTAGIEGTGIVSGFGSVYVDGIEFETQGAEILFNGEASPESRLRVGDVVTVTGVVQDDGTARARRIVFNRTLEGPIEQITMENGIGTLTALGQTVNFDADTAFVNTPVEDLAAGDLIAISGFVGTDGAVDASSIEQGPVFQPNTTRLDAEGTARSVTPSSFMVEGLTVNYGSAIVDESAGTLEDGAFVEVFGVRDADNGAPLVADTVNVLGQNRAEDGDRMFVEAQIRDFAGLDDFTAAGWRIDASDAERLDDTGIDPGLNVRVSVRGTERDGVVRADTLAVEPNPNVTFEATVTAVDSTESTLTILGSTFDVPADTRYPVSGERLDEQVDRTLRLASLEAGDPVRVWAYSDDDSLTTRRIERVEAQNDAIALGAIDRVDSDGSSVTLEVAGTTIRTADGDPTVYYDSNGAEIDATTFKTLAVRGARIEARGPENAGEINTARRVQVLN
ncbi:hypothetical protein SADO_15514 [Salinisphaera dokdonensis CL-ES53]|uniref:DUF5666 domain-containing protein n=1 Tax=Salinisphaera dokdonensis CL-ES53 TaxID=1304272 RepID=A0ABV2B4A7_9GAMM